MKKQTGFTLVELVISIAISAILLSLATPSLRSMIDRNRVDTVTKELATALFYVRSEALKRRTNVVLCVSNSVGTNCESEEAHYDYANGWLIYMDCNNNGSYDQATETCDLNGNGIADTAELLRVHEKLDTHLTVIGHDGYMANIKYSMNGRVKSVGGSLTVDLLTISSNNVGKRKVSVANSGRVSTAKVGE